MDWWVSLLGVVDPEKVSGLKLVEMLLEQLGVVLGLLVALGGAVVAVLKQVQLMRERGLVKVMVEAIEGLPGEEGGVSEQVKVAVREASEGVGNAKELDLRVQEIVKGVDKR